MLLSSMAGRSLGNNKSAIGLFHLIGIHPLWKSFNNVEGGVLSEL